MKALKITFYFKLLTYSMSLPIFHRLRSYRCSSIRSTCCLDIGMRNVSAVTWKGNNIEFKCLGKIIIKIIKIV